MEGDQQNTTPTQTPTQTPPANPQVVVHGTHTAEQVHAAVEKARGEERTKLRDQITQLQNQVTELTAKNTDLNSQLTSIRGLSNGKEINVSEIIQQTANSVRTETESKFIAEMAKLRGELEAHKIEAGKKAIADEKAKIVQEHGGKLIPALLVGDSVEALRASVPSAVQAYQEAIGTVTPTQTPQTPPAAPTPTPPPPISAPESNREPRTPEAPSGTLSNVKALSPKEYAANREKIKAELRAQTS
jgi:TolA-binding protein